MASMIEVVNLVFA